MIVPVALQHGMFRLVEQGEIDFRKINQSRVEPVVLPGKLVKPLRDDGPRRPGRVLQMMVRSLSDIHNPPYFACG
jgi:hypothetical protein